MKRARSSITLIVALALAVASFGLLPTPAYAACSNPSFGYCVRDEFTTQVYSRNDGSPGQTWNGAWTETNDDNSATTGAILVDNATKTLYLQGVTGNTDETGRYIERAKTIPAGYTSATVEFSFNKGSSTATDELVDIMISTDGGTTFTTDLTDRYNGGTAAGTKTFSLGDVAGSTVVIRFRIASDLKPATNDYFSFDNVEIRYSTPLAVTLAAFTANATPSGVTLAWETVSENDNAGFNVYRAAGGSVGDRPQRAAGGAVGDRPQQAEGGAVGDRPQQAAGGAVGDRPQQAAGGAVGDRPQRAAGGAVGDRPQQAAGGAVGDRPQQEEGARSETGPSGEWVRLNAALIPSAAPGSSEGHAYTWTDATALPGLDYAYLLEDVALDGTPTRHAPVTVAAAGQPNAVGLVRFAGTTLPRIEQVLALAGLAALALAASALAGLAGARRRGRR